MKINPAIDHKRSVVVIKTLLPRDFFISFIIIETMDCNDDWLDTDQFIASYQQQGREEGQRDGELHGFEEGYKLGQTTAIDYGMELGFIRGCAQILSETIAKNNDDDKNNRNLDALHHALADFPTPAKLIQDSTEETRTAREQMQRIRARFKVVVNHHGFPMLSLEKAMTEATSLGDDEIGISETLEW